MTDKEPCHPHSMLSLRSHPLSGKDLQRFTTRDYRKGPSSRTASLLSSCTTSDRLSSYKLLSTLLFSCKLPRPGAQNAHRSYHTIRQAHSSPFMHSSLSVCCGTANEAINFFLSSTAPLFRNARCSSPLTSFNLLKELRNLKKFVVSSIHMYVQAINAPLYSLVCVSTEQL